MPLEDLTGTKYINSLNESWPLGTDLPDAGDDHLRGIKNVLKKSFPNIAGAMTRSHGDLNRGSIPAGSRMIFYMIAAPAGWVRFSGIMDTRALRVVPSTDDGAGYGGTHDPILNDKVPSHLHAIAERNTGNDREPHQHNVQGYSNANNVKHTHSGTVSSNGDHTHSLYNTGKIDGAGASGNAALAGSNVANLTYAGAHTHTFTTGDPSSDHQHYINLNSGNGSNYHTHTIAAFSTNTNGSSSNWTPRYMDVIVCQKS